MSTFLGEGGGFAGGPFALPPGMLGNVYFSTVFVHSFGKAPTLRRELDQIALLLSTS